MTCDKYTVDDHVTVTVLAGLSHVINEPPLEQYLFPFSRTPAEDIYYGTYSARYSIRDN